MKMKNTRYRVKLNETNTMSNALIYCRKSSEDKDKQILSLKDQLHETNKLLKQKGMTLIHPPFVEEKSGKQSGVRKEFYEVLDLIEQDKANTVIVWKADRLARNGGDGGRLIELCDSGKLKIVTAFGEYDKSNSIMLWIEFGFSTKYSKDLSDNVIRAMNRKAENGIYPSKAPPGYRNTPRRLKGTREILPDKQFHLVRKWWDLMLSGEHSVPSSYEIIANKGLRGSDGKKLSISAAHRLFRNVFYTGLFDYRKMRYQGIHKPMITMREFMQVQKILDSKGDHSRKGETLPFQGMLRCSSCGATITAEKHTRGDKVHWYYRCTKKLGPCNQPYLKASDLEPQIVEQIKALKLNPDFGVWVRKVLKRRNAQEFMVAKKQHELITKRVSETEDKKEVVAKLRIDGAISQEKYNMRIKELMTEEKSLKESYQVDRTEYWLRVLDKTITFAENVMELFDEGDIFTKRMVLKILGSNIYLKDKMLIIKPKSQFIFLSGLQNTFNEENLWLEQEKSHTLGLKDTIATSMSRSVPPARVERATLSLEPMRSIH